MTEENSPIRLLIVDDEEDLATFLAHRLRKRGLDVTIALSGAEAISAATELKFHVAIVDLKLPDLDGITVMEEIKSIQPFLEILMLTGHGSHDSAWEAGRLQAFRYLLKPFAFDELYDLILAAAHHRCKKMGCEFEDRLEALMAGATSPRDLIEESEKLRREYEQE
ncbi:MAG: response regulator [Gemmatimonadales bacterium]|nr:response regulator [Gemmatimonadales bacterium]